MRVLITGAGGLLGSVLEKEAPEWADVNAIDAEDCDFTDLPMLRARLVVEAPEVIINAAAYTALDEAENDEALARAVNADAVAVMVEAMAETGGKLVHVSSDFVFDGTSGRPYQPGDPRNPLSAYGRTKAAGEDHLRSQDLLVRTSWLYEARGSNFIRSMLECMKAPGELRVVADQTAVPTRATGLALTIWGLLEKGATGIFHHCDDGAASLHDVAVALAEEAHALGLIARMPIIHAITAAEQGTCAQRPAFSVLDCTATRALLGDAPVPWRENLRAMLEEEAALG